MDSGGAAGIYGLGVSCRFPPLQNRPFPLFPSLRSVRLISYDLFLIQFNYKYRIEFFLFIYVEYMLISYMYEVDVLTH